MDSIKDLIKQQLKIEEVIGSYITLIPFGNNFKACCPFHHEKTPSFNVTTDKQMFYCFGCKKGGDIFSFIQEVEHVDFKESLKILTEKAGIDIKDSPDISRELEHKKKLYQIHEYATRYYQLLLTKNEHVQGYLIERGLTKETIEKWRIGYVPDGFSQLTSVLKKKGVSDKDLIDSGLVIQGDKGIYDRFRGRIMFPITDNSGKVVGFSGRIMLGTVESKRDGVGKYINSPETILYHKSKILFGFSHAKQSLSERKSVILVEGQFDALLVSQQGFPNVVAISGTAGTENHIQQLSRFVAEIIIATDRDHAGIQSAKKIAELAYQFDRDVSIIVLPESSDPADIVRSSGETWNELVKNRKDFIEYFVTLTKTEGSQKDRIKSIQDYLFPILKKLPNAMYQDLQLQKIAQALLISSESIRSEYKKFEDNQPQSNNIPIDNFESKRITSNPLQELVCIYKYCPETKNWFIEHESVIQLLGNTILDISESKLAEQLIKYSQFDNSSWNKYLNSLWIRYQQIQIDQDLIKLRLQITNTQDVLVAQELQEKFLQLKTQKEELSRLLSI